MDEMEKKREDPTAEIKKGRIYIKAEVEKMKTTAMQGYSKQQQDSEFYRGNL